MTRRLTGHSDEQRTTRRSATSSGLSFKEARQVLINDCLAALLEAKQESDQERTVRGEVADDTSHGTPSQ